MKKPITAYILTKLFRAASEDDIIYSVCQRTDLSWEQARTLVEQVKNEHQEEIEASQIPLKSLLAFVFYVVGILLTLGPMVYLWIMLDVTKTLLGFISSGFGDAEMALKLFESRCALLGWFELPSIIFTMLLGIGIINVNLRYMRGVWETLFRKWHVID